MQTIFVIKLREWVYYREEGAMNKLHELIKMYRLLLLLINVRNQY
jgi:hypothetical protein